MENQSNTSTKTAMNYGLYLGLALVLTSVVFYVMGKPFSEGILSYLVIIAILIWGIWSFREELGKAGLSYSSALGFGTLTSLFGSLIYAFYTFVLYKVVDHGLLDKLFVYMEQKMLQAGSPENQIEMLMNLYKKILTPLTLSISQIIGVTLTGFIFSLIIAIFLKRESSNPFQGIE
jgi:hypothetical protein